MRLNRGTQIGILLSALVVSASDAGANLRFAHLSDADGLSQSDVRAIVQDLQGFMWFGTWLGGLNRYDGYVFKVYKHDDQDNRSLGCDRIQTLYVDRAGVLWVGTDEGVDRYDRDTDSFVHYRHRADDPSSLPGYQVRFFYEDESGMLWVSSSGGLSRFDRTSGRFFTFSHNPNDPTSFGDTGVRPVCLDTTTGLLWVGAGSEGVCMLDRSTGHYTRYKHDPKNPASLSTGGVQFIYRDRTGTLWISTMGGLNRFDPQTQTFIRYRHDPRDPASLSEDYVTMAFEDRAGRFWVATINGLNLMDRARGTFTRYQYDPGDSGSLSSNVINWGALYEDASGALWIGLRSSGVDRLAGEAERFTTYRHSSQDTNSPNNNVITSLARGSAGALWIGTEAGLDRFDGQTFTHYLADPNDASSLSPGPQRVVAEDTHGAVWTGTYGGGLDRLDGQRVKHFHHDAESSDSPGNDNICSLVPDAAGGLWIGVHGKGVDYFDGRHFTHFPADPGNPVGLPGAFVRPLLLDRQGMLWICEWGLVRLDTHTRQFKTYLMDPNQPGSQPVNWSADLYSDGSSIWVASSTGLYRFDPETGKFTHHYTEKDGLANNSVVGVVGDAQGNIWVSTVNGLSRFDQRTEIFRNYDAFDGLQGDEFSQFCRARAPDGQLFFGGVKGLSAFYPDRLADNPAPPPVVLTEFELFNKPVKVGGKGSPLQQAIHVAASIALHHDQSVFSFQFAALNYTVPQKNKYAYKLEGFDRDWRYTDASRRFATYTHLDPGNYTFRVKASNNDGVWNEQGVALHLVILPPWWKTNWFRAACVAVILALVWLAHRFRVRELEEREKKFREAVESLPALAFVAASEKDRTFVNRGWVEYTGLTLKQALGSGWQVAVHPDDLKRVLEKWRTAATTGEPLDYEVRLRHGGNGEYRWFHTRVVPLRDKHGLIVKWCGVATDVEDRKRAAETSRRLNRELRAISDCNQTLLRATDEQSLIKEICRIACEEAGYRLTWVGYAEHDEARSVRPVAWTGAEEEYLATADVTWADTELGRGPTGTAIRSGTSCCIQDFATDDRVAPWREGALQRGFRSGIALPLKDEHGNAFGSLTILSEQPNAFTSEEIRLLEELAGDLAFGIVTLRSRAARERAEKEVGMLNFALDNVREAAFLVDDRGRFDYVNEEACRVLGYSRAELLGMGIADIDPEFPAERWADHWRDLKAQRSLSFESRHRTRDGRIFPVEVSANYFEYAGRAYHLALVRDITERKQAQEALRESETRFRTFVDHAPDALFMLDSEQWTIIDVNRPACEGLGYTREELIGKTPLAFDVSLDRATLESVAARTAAGETVLFDPHWHRRKDGSLFPVEVHTNLFWHGGRRFLLKVARDISERVQAGEALKSSEADRRRTETALQETRTELEHVSRVTTMGALTASIAHEVNQPLAGVVTSANAGLNWLAGQPPNLSKAREALERVRRDGTRAGEVLARIRGLLKRTPSAKTMVSVNQIMNEVLAITAGELRGHHIETELALDPHLPTVLGDTIRLQQVLLNLITNAIEAMVGVAERRRTLRIQSSLGVLEGRPAVVVALSDAGIGFGNTDLARLFEPFHTTKPQGMGLGLWISRSIIEEHGGRLAAQSNPGPGATFVVTIPVESQAAA